MDKTTLTQNKRRDRPKSSRFPPLVPMSPEQDCRERSSSFDYSFTDCIKQLKSGTNSNELNTQSNTQFDSEKRVDMSVSPVLLLGSSDEHQRLKNENQILKNNFLRMSRIIQKHSRIIAKKDDLILKLQTQQSNCMVKTELVPFRFEFTGSVNTTNEIQTKNNEFSDRFRQIFNSMISDFGQHLNQFMRVMEEMQSFLENNLKIVNKNNLKETEFESRLQILNTEYLELKSSYEMLAKQNMDFKSFIEFVIQTYDLDTKLDITSDKSIDDLKNCLKQINTTKQTMNVESDVIQKYQKTEEEYCFDLIEVLSETELELELLGRNPQTLNKVIEKFQQKLLVIREMLSQTYFESLNKILLQIYKNQLKWIQFPNRPSKSTQTWFQTNIDDSSTEDEETVRVSKSKQLVSFEEYKEVLADRDNKDIKENEISDEIQSKFDQLSDELSFDDFDIQTINYILMSKHNLKTNLEVVEEVEEEVEEEAEEEGSEMSYEDDVFEPLDQNPNKCLNVTENSETDVENIELIVKQVLNQILDKIVNQFSTQYSVNLNVETNIEIDQDIFNKEPDLPKKSSSDSEKEEEQLTTKLVAVKPHYIDSDFVSDEISSSPETVLPLMENIIEQYTKTGYGHGHGSLVLLSSPVYSLESVTEKTDEVIVTNTEHKLVDRPQTKESQYLSDELKAWKELVEQQKAIMEKIRTELELQQKLNYEKDITIESLKKQTITESLAKIPENQTPVQQRYELLAENFENELKSEITDELDLNKLFVGDNYSDEDDLEVIVADNNRIQTNNFTKNDSNLMKSPDIPVQQVWNNLDDLSDKNDVSDDSSCSVYTDNSTPYSMPELQSNRRKVFIPYSHEDAAVRRHSCQGRILRYGNHPRKKKLELKTVDIVFPQQKEMKRLKEIEK